MGALKTGIYALREDTHGRLRREIRAEIRDRRRKQKTFDYKNLSPLMRVLYLLSQGVSA